jgi:hypothetical protein
LTPNREARRVAGRTETEPKETAAVMTKSIRVKIKDRANSLSYNHNQKSIRAKLAGKAQSLSYNHNQKSIRAKLAGKAQSLSYNHNQAR